MPAAKNGTTTQPAPANVATPPAVESTQALAVAAPQELAAPETTEIPQDLLDHEGVGLEQIDRSTLQPARLMLCQAGTPYRDGKVPNGVAGLNELDLYHSKTRANYGRGPVKMVVIGTLPSHWMKFDKDGKVEKRRVSPNDPDAQWTKDEKGNATVKPKATQFLNYLVWLPEHEEMLTFSMKSTQLKVAKDMESRLCAPLKLAPGVLVPSPPAWARTFDLSTFMDAKEKFNWGNFKIEPAGITPTPTRLLCAKLAERFLPVIKEVDTTQEMAEDSEEAKNAIDAEYTRDEPVGVAAGAATGEKAPF